MGHLHATKLLLGADYSRDKTNGSCRHLQNLDAAAPAVLGPLWMLGMSSAYKEDVRNCSTQFNTEQERTLKGFLGRFDVNMNWGTFTSITAWRESDYTLVDDLTGVPLNNPATAATIPENVIDASTENAKQFSQEFRSGGRRFEESHPLAVNRSGRNVVGDVHQHDIVLIGKVGVGF